jgi:hypothetical protein
MQVLLRDAGVAREIALEIAGIVDEHAVGIELIGLAAETAERLAGDRRTALPPERAPDASHPLWALRPSVRASSSSIA